MANWYVWSGAAGAGTGADWANAYVRLRLATAAKAAGDTFFVAHDHAETEAAAMTIASPGTELLPCRIYCVNRAGSVPPVSANLRATATISTTGASSAITLSGSVAECYGIIFNSGDAANIASISVGNSSSQAWRMNGCSLRLLNTSTASRIVAPSATSANLAILENTTMQFGNVSQGLRSGGGRLIWRNTPSAILGATLPTVLLVSTSVNQTLFEGVDLSALASGKTITQTTGNMSATLTLKDCRLGSSVTVGPPPNIAQGGQEISLIRCDSGDTNYRTEKYAYGGTMTTETTIVRTGGASDGTTPISWKIVTTANCEKEFPFECLPISVWNETTGSAVTVTIQGIWGGGAVPLNDEIWIDVEYLGTSGFPLATKATSGKANGLAAGANIPAGSGTWGGSTTKFAMSAPFTPREKGPLTIYVRAAKPSSTFYIDPKPVITYMARQYAVGGPLGAGYVADQEDRDFSLPETYVAAPAAVAGDVVLPADAGAYAVTGTDATPKLGRRILADIAGSYSIAGSTASLEHGWRVAADTAGYAVAGAAAGLERGLSIAALAGSYAIDGTAAQVEAGRSLSADAGTYQIIGADAAMAVAAELVLAAGGGAYAVGGQAAALALATGAGLVGVWDGSAWIQRPAKVWTGSAWMQKPVKVWNGSAWT